MNMSHFICNLQPKFLAIVLIHSHYTIIYCTTQVHTPHLLIFITTFLILIIFPVNQMKIHNIIFNYIYNLHIFQKINHTPAAAWKIHIIFLHTFRSKISFSFSDVLFYWELYILWLNFESFCLSPTVSGIRI